MNTKEKIRQALEEARWSAVKKMMQDKPFFSSMVELQTEAVYALFPKWYRTSADLPGEMEVKLPEQNQPIVWKNIDRTSHYVSNITPRPQGLFYWYPIEPLNIEP